MVRGNDVQPLVQVVGGDGNRENFDPQEFRFIGSIIQASTGLLVTFQGMSISHHNQVFILLVMGTTDEQLLDAALYGAIGVGALPDVVDRRHAVLQLALPAGHRREALDEHHLVTVVQRSRVPHQVAVAAVVPLGEFINEPVGEIFHLGNQVPKGLHPQGNTL